ncbi:MAG: DUF1223 domain-containing protein [Acidobacteriota bacterium]
MILRFTIVGLALMFAVTALAGRIAEDDRIADPLSRKNLILVELFTSQGCSSCPPADRLMGTFTGSKDVAVLAFHVDYWNRLGWQDPFSQSAWSVRQRDYALAMDLETVYTPQMVVDGLGEGVGSDASELKKLLAEARQRERPGLLTQTRTGVDLRLLDPIDQAAELWVAEVENGLVTQVERGENADRTLHNHFVVRKLTRLAELRAGTRGLSRYALPEAENENRHLVVFLQQKGFGRVLLAQRF